MDEGYDAVEGDRWTGWVAFAGILMIIGGCLQGFYGLVAIVNDTWVVWGNSGTVYLDITQWGWVHLIWGAIMILAGLQAIPKELTEAAKVDGAGPWTTFWEITFPLMLPVSVTAILIRIIFKLKLADIVINLTAGGPGGATDTVTSFIFREYRDRSNVGYGTLLAMIYLVIIIIAMTILMKLAERFARPRT